MAAGKVANLPGMLLRDLWRQEQTPWTFNFCGSRASSASVIVNAALPKAMMKIFLKLVQVNHIEA